MQARSGWVRARLSVLAFMLLGGGPVRVAQALAPALEVERAVLMREGEAALVEGQARVARQRFERAVSLRHSADAEIALVRALMQGGEAVQASTYSAHTAGAHRQVAEGAVLYAWLLDLSGQHGASRRLLDEAAGRFPGDPLIAAMRARGPGEAPAVPEGAIRLKPFTVGVTVPRSARVVASGTLIAEGREALVPLEALGPSASPGRIWVRDGLGQTVRTRDVRRLPSIGLAVLRLEPALQARSMPRAIGDEPRSLPLPEPVLRDPFPGSPAYVVLYPAAAGGTGTGEPAWPRLHVGFLGGGAPPDGRHLGVEVPAGGRLGGPVLDAAGRWSGVAVGPRVEGGAARFVPVSALRQALGDGRIPAGAAGPAGLPPSAEAIHEAGLRVALQVLLDVGPVRPGLRPPRPQPD